ncbi:MAG: leucine-rich repeat domain-containing protein [Clostridiales bacterium]|nr:leucine-rich repeat domain-containing protein [Clostridiales bacterium]
MSEIILTGEDVLKLDLDTVRIPSGYTKIDRYAFSGCEDLGTVILPDTAEVIGKGAFEGCYNLAAVVVPHGSKLHKIGKKAFADTELTTLAVPADTVIAKNAFKGCRNFDGLIYFDSIRNYITPNYSYKGSMSEAADAFKTVAGVLKREIAALDNSEQEENSNSNSNIYGKNREKRKEYLNCLISILADEFKNVLSEDELEAILS